LSCQGVRVVTTETLAEGYGIRVTNIRTNLDANRQRFIEGLHLYTVSGKELADLRVSNPDAQISSKTRSLILSTEWGAARMPSIDVPIQLANALTGLRYQYESLPRATNKYC